MYLLDTDVLVHAYRHDFPPDTDPGEFWRWLEQMIVQTEICIPDVVFDEVQQGTDTLYSHIASFRDLMRIAKDEAAPQFQRVLEAYGEITENDLEALDQKADPYLIAHALTSAATIVTNEISRPNATAALNKKIPDICSYLGVQCVRYPRFLWNMSSTASNPDLE